MTLTPEQKQAVSGWVAAGDNLSVIQRKLIEQFQVTMTYMDVRFLVDDLNLSLKDAAPRLDPTDLKGAGMKTAPAAGKAPEKKGLLEKAKEKLGLGRDEAPDALPGDPTSADTHAEDLDLEDDLAGPGGAGGVSVSVDKVTLIPGAVASGTVTFSDGVTGKWIVDNYGRPGFTEVSKKDYRPNAADSQSFMQELSAALQRRGF